MDFSEKWGKDVDEAVRLALIDLKLTEDQVNVIVLEEPTKGFLGLGAKLAKVRVEKKTAAPKAEEKKEEKTQKAEASFRQEKPQRFEQERRPEKRDNREQREYRDNRESRDNRRNDRPKQTGDAPVFESTFSVREKPADLVDLTDHAAEAFLKEITQKMGLSLKVKVQGNDSCIYVEMDGKDSGTIIGKRGQTLDAIQYLTSLVVNKDREKYMRVVVDAENYREKIERTL